MNKVISLEKKREELEFKKKELNLKKYLESLKTNELQYEANDIIDQLNNGPVNNDDIFKGAVLMEEFAKRIDTKQMSEQVTSYANGLKTRLELLQ
jgi:hypothetical protein